MNRYHFNARFAPAPLPPEQTRPKPTCSRCGREIVYVEMEKSAKLMPCDTAQRYGDGTRHLVVRYPKGRRIVGRVVTYAGEDVLGLEPHWGTCPARPGLLQRVEGGP